jgi:hypothetical protein
MRLTLRLVYTASIAALLIDTSELHGQAIQNVAARKCVVSAERWWLAAEHEAWATMCRGDVAFVSPLRRAPRLRATFLESTLLNANLTALLPRGFRLANAYIAEPLNLRYADIKTELWLDACVFAAPVDLYNTRFGRSASFENSKFTRDLNLGFAHVVGQLNLTGAAVAERLNLDGVEVGSILFLDKGTFSGQVNARGLRVKDQVMAADGKFHGGLNLDGAQVGGLLLLDGVTAPDVNLRAVRIGDSLSILGAANIQVLRANGVAADVAIIVRGTAPTDKANVQSIQLRNVSTGTMELQNLTAGRIDLENGRFSGNVYVSDVHVNLIRAPFADVHGMITIHRSKLQQLDLNSCRTAHVGLDTVAVSANLNLPFAEVRDTVVIADTTISGDLDLSGLRADTVELGGGTYASVNLNSANIASTLSLGGGRARAKWYNGGRLTLVNAHAGAIEDRQDAWPKMIELEGFTYQRWGASEPFLRLKEGTADSTRIDLGEFRTRPDKWFHEWLRAQDHFSLEPYLQLASAFRVAGLDKRASDIMYEGKDRERRNASGAKRVGLSLSMLVTGYGLRYERSVYWSVAFIVAGWAAIRLAKAHRKYGYRLGLAYSLDMFLPIVQLRRRHYDIDLNPPLRYYFYVHRLAGFVIGSFVLAAIAGLR